ncbi:MAG: hypothetical protein HYU66_07755 [Armatimonadetes bacterium]|nr:hypothetical protein [Armatimonadota bacterium]
MRRGVALAACLACLAAARGAVYVEAEAFQYPGSWQIESGTLGAFGGRCLASLEGAGGRPAVAVVPIPRAGAWQLRVRAKDFPHDRPGIRRFAVEVDGQRSGREFGAHGRDDANGWDWEDGGTLQLSAGEVLVALVPVTAYSRCDAVALTAPGEDVPHSPGAAARAAAALPPAEPLTAPEPAAVIGEPLASLRNERVTLTFHAATLGPVESVALAVAEGGRAVLPPTPETWLVLRAPADVELRQGVTPTWSSFRPVPCRVSRGGASYDTSRGYPTWLPCAGELEALHPTRELRQTGDTVALQARGAAGSVEATWRLEPADQMPRLTLRLTAAVEGSFGLGYRAGPALAREAVTEVLCPFLYAFRRLPREPKLVPLAVTSTPMAAVQTGTGGTAVCVGVALEPTSLPAGWPDLRTTGSGFQLVDASGLAAPIAWSPVPGGPGAKLAAGGTAELNLRLVAVPGDWFAAWQRVAGGLYGLRDYRHNAGLSLTDTALNVIDLLKDPDACGWSDAGLGFWNIASRNTVTQAAPLVPLEAALLTGDEALLAERAVPTLAHLLSRPAVHSAAVADGDAGYGSRKLGAPMALYGSTVRFGAAALTRGYAPAFHDCALDTDGQPLATFGYGKGRPFEDALAAWRATGEERFRELARRDLRAYLAEYVAGQTEELSPVPFYQLTYVGNWEGLLHAAEQLGDPALTAAAADLARRMITGLYTWPRVRDGAMTVHPGGRFEGNGYRWWKGPRLELLGYPPAAEPDERHAGPAAVAEETVEAWRPSAVGLGIEQPVTYARRLSPGAMITMANWAPALLRLATADHEPALATAAHNALLGRWGSYPGYYVTGFNALMSRPDYPLRGPDVSGIYYHHIPPFLGLLLDYLVTDVEVRSNGRIAFPWERQCGYAWFDNRVFGHRPGRVYGTEGVWPWLRRGVVTLDTPLVNWLAGHSADRVFAMLTNTSGTALEATLRLDPAVTGGAAGPVTWRADGGPERPVALAGGALRVPVSGQGLTVVEWRGCRVTVPLHAEPPAPRQNVAGTATVTGDAIVGTVRAEWLAVDPDHAFVHVYSDHDGSQAVHAEVRLRQNGAERALTRDGWPLEILAKVDGRQAVALAFTVRDAEGRQHSAPELRLEPPG